LGGNPAAFLNAVTAEGVPTKTEVPVSTIPPPKVIETPLQVTLSKNTTHQAYNLTG